MIMECSVGPRSTALGFLPAQRCCAPVRGGYRNPSEFLDTEEVTGSSSVSPAIDLAGPKPVPEDPELASRLFDPHATLITWHSALRSLPGSSRGTRDGS